MKVIPTPIKTAINQMLPSNTAPAENNYNSTVLDSDWMNKCSHRMDNHRRAIESRIDPSQVVEPVYHGTVLVLIVQGRGHR